MTDLEHSGRKSKILIHNVLIIMSTVVVYKTHGQALAHGTRLVEIQKVPKENYH